MTGDLSGSVVRAGEASEALGFLQIARKLTRIARLGAFSPITSRSRRSQTPLLQEHNLLRFTDHLDK